MQLVLEISIVSEVYLTKSPVWHLPLDMELLCSTLSVLSDPRHFGIIASEFRLESFVPNKWILCWRDLELGVNKRRLGPGHDLSP